MRRGLHPSPVVEPDVVMCRRRDSAPSSADGQSPTPYQTSLRHYSDFKLAPTSLSTPQRIWGIMSRISARRSATASPRP